MATTTTIKGVTLTPTAKAAVIAKGADAAALQAQILLKVAELRVLLAQLIALHPSGGADATNFTTLSNELANLA